MKNNTRKLKIALAVVGFTFAILPSITSATTIVLKATHDGVLLDGNNTNNESLGILGSELDTSAAGNIWISILKFDLSSLAGMNVNSASFELTSFFNHSSSSFAHEVYSSVNDSWTEDTVTGVNRPLDSSLTFLDSADISGISQTYSWDVLTGVTGTDGLAGTNDFLTLLLRPELSQAGSGEFGAHFKDRENLSQFPVLLVDASPVPVPTAVWLFSSGLIGLYGAKAKLKKTITTT
ncbi:MAG: DNRLRE domain-containing protein [Methylococcaceae bacterium]